MTTPKQLLKIRTDAARLGHIQRRIFTAWSKINTESIGNHEPLDLDHDARSWYDTAQSAALAMDPDNVTRAAGVIAALSPRQRWSTNINQSIKLLAEADSNPDGPPPRVSTTTMRKQAWRIALGEHPLDVLHGPKVRRFYRNITGDLTAVTVDTWIARLALIPTNQLPESPHPRAWTELDLEFRTQALNRNTYRLIERAFVNVASRPDVNLPPAVLQAILWTQIRGASQ